MVRRRTHTRAHACTHTRIHTQTQRYWNSIATTHAHTHTNTHTHTTVLEFIRMCLFQIVQHDFDWQDFFKSLEAGAAQYLVFYHSHILSGPLNRCLLHILLVRRFCARMPLLFIEKEYCSTDIFQKKGGGSVERLTLCVLSLSVALWASSEDPSCACVCVCVCARVCVCVCVNERGIL